MVKIDVNLFKQLDREGYFDGNRDCIERWRGVMKVSLMAMTAFQSYVPDAASELESESEGLEKVESESRMPVFASALKLIPGLIAAAEAIFEPAARQQFFPFPFPYPA